MVFLDAFPTCLQKEKNPACRFWYIEVRDRAEKQARNPKTGETITVPACKTTTFKAGKALKDAVAK